MGLLEGLFDFILPKKGKTYKCPDCGTAITLDMKRCPKCGTHISTMFKLRCPNCKELNELDAERCKKCKYDFAAERYKTRSIYVCPICGYRSEAYLTQCPSCGTRFI
ncbi:MAG: zinc ribbon domain-containing protein [Candidatus Anstonellales archaeon]